MSGACCGGEGWVADEYRDDAVEGTIAQQYRTDPGTFEKRAKENVKLYAK